jgi:sugar phosphate isomerase/epimerase
MAEVEGCLSKFWLENGLTYCLNIHPAETLLDVLETLRGPVSGVKSRLCPDARFPIGLRISGQTMADLAASEARAELAKTLRDGNLVPVSMNGFPYGTFHGTRVKEEVYLPDWRAAERLGYTCALIELMADLSEPGQFVSLSTVPGAFKTNGQGAEKIMATNIVDAAVHAARMSRKTGCTVALAIEPEPCCFLETIAEAVDFFAAHLYGEQAIRQMSRELDVSAGEASDLLRKHLGLCYDVCHAAVEFEDPFDSIETLRGAGIPVHKLQLSSALRVPEMTCHARQALEPFAEPTYLHQVVAKGPEGLRRDIDLAPALARGADSDGEEWRVHFHVPVFLAELEHFGTTQGFLKEVIALHKADSISPHLEVETYTWGVLPNDMRGATIEDDVARELEWVRGELAC